MTTVQTADGRSVDVSMKLGRPGHVYRDIDRLFAGRTETNDPTAADHVECGGELVAIEAGDVIHVTAEH